MKFLSGCSFDKCGLGMCEGCNTTLTRTLQIVAADKYGYLTLYTLSNGAMIASKRVSETHVCDLHACGSAPATPPLATPAREPPDATVASSTPHAASLSTATPSPTVDAAHDVSAGIQALAHMQIGTEARSGAGKDAAEHFVVVSSGALALWHIEREVPYNVVRGGHCGPVVALYACSGGLVRPFFGTAMSLHSVTPRHFRCCMVQA